MSDPTLLQLRVSSIQNRRIEDSLPGPTLCFPLNEDEALAPNESLNDGIGGALILALKNGFVLDRVGINGFELDAAKNGFLSPLAGEVDMANSCVGERRGEGGRAGAGKLGGRGSAEW